LLKAANTPPGGDTCPAASVPGWRGVGVLCASGVFAFVGVGFGGATVRVRVGDGEVVDGIVVEEFEFCANPTPAHKDTTKVMTKILFSMI
jgi:hypothetical protein